MFRELREELRSAQGPPGPPGAQRPTGPQGGIGNGSGENIGGWKPEVLAFFWPDLKMSYGEGDVVTVNGDTCIPNVYVFVERLRDLAATKGAALVRSSVDLSLRGKASKWYIGSTSQIERAGLRFNPNSVKLWCSVLVKKFKESLGNALEPLRNKKYILQDARNRREPEVYVHTIVRIAQAANYNNVQNQLTYAHQGLALELRAHIAAPTPDTSISSIVEAIQEKKDIWFEIYRGHSARDNQVRPPANRSGQDNGFPHFSE